MTNRIFRFKVHSMDEVNIEFCSRVKKIVLSSTKQKGKSSNNYFSSSINWLVGDIRFRIISKMKPVVIFGLISVKCQQMNLIENGVESSRTVIRFSYLYSKIVHVKQNINIFSLRNTWILVLLKSADGLNHHLNIRLCKWLKQTINDLKMYLILKIMHWFK